MRYQTAKAFRQALEHRLLTRAQQANTPVDRLRREVVFDRLLARLCAVARDRWILKGAVALDYRLGLKSRTTRDMDLGRQDDEKATADDFLAAQAADLGDHFRFTISRTGRLDRLTGATAVRYHVKAGLDGRVFENVLVDVGFGGPPVTTPDILRGPALLEFAGIDPAEAPVLPLEQHVAEKVHAYTRTYAGGRQSTRVKDLVDLVLILSNFEFEAGQLRRALRDAFDSRGVQALPAALPPPPDAWTGPYREMAVSVSLDPDIATGYRAAAGFLDPILEEGETDHAQWDASQQKWSG